MNRIAFLQTIGLGIGAGALLRPDPHATIAFTQTCPYAIATVADWCILSDSWERKRCVMCCTPYHDFDALRAHIYERNHSGYPGHFYGLHIKRVPYVVRSIT